MAQLVKAKKAENIPVLRGRLVSGKNFDLEKQNKHSGFI